MRLAGEVAIVQGGTRGMGRKTALRFAAEGAKVVVTGRNDERGKEVEKAILDNGGDGIFVRTDISDEDQVRTAVDAAVHHYGKLTVLVNNAGATEHTLGESKIDDLVADVTADAWDSIFRTDLRGTWLSCKYSIRAMLDAGRGSITNVSSVAAQFAVPGLAAYSAAKAGLNALTRSIAIEYASHGIRANCVVIGIVPNWQTTCFGEPDWQEALRASQPLRLGAEEDLANLATFLSSPEAGYMTAGVINLDGGYQAVPHLPKPPSTGGDPAMLQTTASTTPPLEQ